MSADGTPGGGGCNHWSANIARSSKSTLPSPFRSPARSNRQTQTKRVMPTGCDSRKTCIGRRHKSALTEKIVSPGYDRAVGFQANRVIHAGRYGRKIYIGRRHSTLTVSVVAPGRNRTVGLQTKRVNVASRYGRKTSIGRRHSALTVLVVSPGHNRAVLFKTKRVKPAGRDGRKTSIGQRHIALTEPVIPPGSNRAVLFKTKRMILAGRDGCKTSIGDKAHRIDRIHFFPKQQSNRRSSGQASDIRRPQWL